MKVFKTVVLMSITAFNVSAFNLETHAIVTLDAKEKSVLADSNLELAQRYGFDRLEPKRVFDNQSAVRCGSVSPNSVAYRDGYIDARDPWLNAPGGNPRPVLGFNLAFRRF